MYKFEKKKQFLINHFIWGFSVLELGKILIYEFYYKSLEPYWHDCVLLHYMDIGSVVLSFDANNQELTNF